MGQAIRDWHLHKPFDRQQDCISWTQNRARARLIYPMFNGLGVMQAKAGVRWQRRPLMRYAQLTGATVDWSSVIETDHNHVRRESHFGDDLWVHRKGTASARADEPGVIPGSMGTETYHVMGRGCSESLCSSSHGAGRAMSRHEGGRQAISSRNLSRQIGGVWFDQHLADKLREEAPAAYKDIRAVMRAQRRARADR